MKPFVELTQAGQVRRLRRVAEQALAAYDLPSYRLSPLEHMENTTFRVDTTDGRFMLRLARPGLRTPAELRSELQWLGAIRADTDLHVPEPVRTRQGGWLSRGEAPGVPQPHNGVLFRWVYGRFSHRNVRPTVLERIGAVTARLHRHARQFTFAPGFKRNVIGWGSAEHPGESARFYDRARDLGAHHLDAAGWRLVDAVRERTAAAMDAIGRASDVYGLIHADLHTSNCLFNAGETGVIDFDDCGFAPFLLDGAITLYYFRKRPDFPVLRKAYWRGYTAVAPAPDRTHLDTLIIFRTLIMLIYLLGRPDNPRLRQYIPGYIKHTLPELQAFLTNQVE